MIETISYGFVLGFSTGGYCLSRCLPLLLPYVLYEGENLKYNFKIILEFLLGRLTAYIVLGVVIGFSGNLLQTKYGKIIVALAMMVSSVLLLLHASVKINYHKKVCENLSKKPIFKRFPFFLGVAVGVNLCPPFLQGILYLLNIGKVMNGIVFFTTFFIATSIYVLPLAFYSLASKFEKIKSIAQAAAIISGIYFFVYGVIMLITA